MTNSLVDVQKAMSNSHSIRNVAVISHLRHGKSSLIDSLTKSAGIISSSEEKTEYNVTIKASGVSLYHDFKILKPLERGLENAEGYLFNIMDSPGHVDFYAEFTTALRMTDGVILVVDALEGVQVQTISSLQHALGERLRPVLTISKMDKCFMDLNLGGEEAYQKLNGIINNLNSVVLTFEDRVLGDLCPIKGTVSFSSALHGWGFTLRHFAREYAQKFGVDEMIMTRRLWGENFFDTTTRVWTTHRTRSPTCVRGFVLFCYSPLQQVIHSCMDPNTDKLWPMVQKLGILLNADERQLTGKLLMKRVLRSWLPISTMLFEKLILHIPSPPSAQSYKMGFFYKGAAGDLYSKAMRTCDMEGPLMIYVSQMIPSAEKGRFDAFGRVLSGKVRSGMRVRIMSSDGIHVKSIHKTSVYTGKKFESFDEIPCGNFVAISGLDKVIKCNTIVTCYNREVTPSTIRDIKFTSFPVVRVAVNSNYPSGDKRIVDCLKRMAILNPAFGWISDEETREILISGPGELYVEKCLEELQGLMGCCRIEAQEPIVSYCETIAGRSEFQVVIKSTNKLTTIYMEADPMEEGLAEAIENNENVSRVRVTVRKFGWSRARARTIIEVGPANCPTILLDMTVGAIHSKEIKNTITMVTSGHQGMVLWLSRK